MAFLLCLALAVGLRAGDDKKNDPGQIGNRDVAGGVNFYSMEKEMALGRELAQEVERQSKLLDDPIIAEYVNRLGQNLVRHSDAKFPFTFKVVDDPSLNAFALPGGYVFVNRGLIEIADEEDELAGAMAHEIAHVAARHMTREATRSDMARLLSAPARALGGRLSGYAAGAALPAAVVSFNRKDESEADYLGVQYMYAAGYDPNGTISIFEKLESLERKSPGAVSRLFATHPPDAERIRLTQEEIERILPARPEYVVNTSEYSAMRQRLIDLDSKRGNGEPERRPQLRTEPGAQ
ncbi:MAG: M48 family metallopeptidase [Bryobacteraceae bacterium]